ncbi:hypothetical protein FF124_12995 [Martelella lutilitoris]|uniref:Cas10/Cmr2 second palm domain-containing protein n=1 Tax=Martelella lutilitoris TaxID=2583532 RepID=A0A5C4JNT1_9HYPH|nr:hypothetical protein [Martelella lutilitoris]TNB47095.1 hypothetical protein FF124_12995 [Martelella lutilitoris]
MIETLSNQAYIFATNRLREMTGASEQVRLAGCVWPDEEAMRINAGGAVLEPVLLTSGKALFVAASVADAEKLVAAVSRRALVEAPGLGLVGAHVALVDDDPQTGVADFHRALKAVHLRLAQLRAAAPPDFAHLQRLPFAADCHSSGAGASGFDANDPAWRGEGLVRDFSLSVLQKRAFRPSALDQLRAVLGLKQTDQHQYDTGEDDEGWDENWRAVIHIDGNGIGQIFLKFDEFVARAGGKSQADYRRYYVDFSEALDQVNRQAVHDATRETWAGFFAAEGAARTRTSIPIKPLVLAGDDLTVICDGTRAIRFARAFVEKFRQASAENKAINQLICDSDIGGVSRAFSGVRMGGGIAVVKPHHPFYRAYELAAALADSAKSEPKKQGLSALDFHVSYDGISDLGQLRNHNGNQNFALHGGPYVLEKHAAFRSMCDLESCVATLHGDAVPRGQAHRMREAVMLGPDVAEAARQRFNARSSEPLAELFYELAGLNGRATMFLDAMAIMDTQIPENQSSPKTMQGGRS